MTMTATPAAPSLLPGEDTGASDSDGVINLSGPLLTGQTAPNAVITLYDNGVMATTASVGMDAPGTTTADANGFYTIFPYPVLDDGKHSLTITATAPGQTASLYSPPLAIVVDTSPPDPPTAPVLAKGFDTGVSAADGITDKNTLQLTGTTEPKAMVALFNGSSTTPLAQVMAAANGSYTLNTGVLADGVYNLTVKATDLAGNIGKASAATSITVDTTPPATPAAPTLSPGTDSGVSHSDGLTNNTTPVVVGTAEANSTVLLYDGGKQIAHAQADASGNYAITTPTLMDGAHTLTVAAEDAAGNTGAASAALNVVVDTAHATGTSTAQADQAIFGSVPFTLHFSEAVSGLTPQALTLTTTGTAVGEIASITGSGSDYTVTVDGLSGAGTLGLALAPGNALTDEAGNAVQLTSSQSYEIANQDAPNPILVGTYPFDGTDGVIATSFSGRLVAFDSTAAQTPGATVSGQDLYVSDLRTGGLTQITADGYSGLAALSADGKTMVFVSTADDLVPGSPTDGAANVYVAHLSTSNVASGQAVTVTSIQLVSQGNGADGIDGFTQSALPNEEGPDPRLGGYEAPAISADGTHVAFVSSQALIDGVTAGTGNVYEEDLATGDLTLISSTPGGTAGNAGSDEPSLSGDGSKVVFESGATDLTDTPTPQFTEQSYVYDNTASTLTQLNAAAQLGFTYQAGYYGPAAIEPKINALGNWVTYTIQLIRSSGADNQISFVVNQNIVNGKLELVTPDTLYNYDDQSDVSYGGRYVSYQGNDLGYIDGQAAYQVVVQDAVGGVNNAIASGVAPVLASDGDAVAFDSPLYSAPDSNGFITQLGGDFIVETLGPTVGINPVEGDDEIGAPAWKQALASGLTVLGVTDAPDGSTVQLQLISVATGATVSTLPGIAVAGGLWTGTLAAADLAGLPDGNYKLNAVAGASNGASFPSNRVVTVDTMPPAAPAAPKLDAGSDTSLASDGSATNQDTPIITGTAEAGSTVTLYDASGVTPAAIGTAVADGTGVYAITAAPLKDGRHTLDVTATDAAGNVSAGSAALTITVDTIVPATPSAPALQPASSTGDQFTGTSFDTTDSPPTPASDTGISDTDGITSNATPNVIGTAEPGTTVTLYDTDGKSMLGTATVKPDGTYIIAASQLAEGAHTLTVTDTDLAGNVSPASDPLAVTIDTLPPLQPTISSITGPLVAGDITPLVTVNGTAEPNSKVSLVLDGGMGADSVFGESTAASDGDYSINSDYLPAGDGQNLTVIATDAAGNASQPSLPADVNITGSATPPPGVPAGTPTLLGLLTDGPIAGATVFADANGNGVQDPGEATTLTSAAGTFTLYGPVGPLEAFGGKDTTTGLSLPGALFAPAGSTVIDPLTTLVYAYQQLTGDVTAQANAAVAAALGLLGGGATDLTTLDPDAAALAGSPSLDPAVANGAAAVANAKLADLATDFSDALSYYAATESLGGDFANAFRVMATMIAALPPGGTLNLDDPGTLLAIANGTAELAHFVQGVPVTADTAAEEIVAAGNAQLDADGTSKTGQALLTAIAGVETVDQGSAATALNTISQLPGAAQTLVPDYTGAPLASAAMVTASSIIDAPRLAASSNGGVSTRDNIIGTTAPTFVGTALPGTYVTLVEIVGSYHPQGQVVGSTQANALGQYSITTVPFASPGGNYFDETPYAIAAVGSTTNQNLAIGSVIDLPTGTQVQDISIDGQSADESPEILDATAAGAAGDDAGHSALEVYVLPQVFGTIQIYADGGAVPIASRAVLDVAEMTLTTVPLSLGTHTLTLTETLPGGTVLAGYASYTATVTAASVVNGTATAVGPIAGATVFQYDKSPLDESGDNDVVRTVTDASGGYAATEANTYTPLTLTNGYDTITGLPLGGPLLAVGAIATKDTLGAQDFGGFVQLTAPAGYSAITPFSSIVNALDLVEGTYDPAATAGNAAATLSAVGLQSNADDGEGEPQPAIHLTTLDPVAMAEAGDPAPLIASIKLLDTASLLTQLYGYTYLPFADAIAGNGTLDLDDASGISAIIAYDYAPPSYEATVTPAQVAEIASVVAAGNAAIDAHAAAATSLADTLSYAFASERLEQTAVVEAINVAFNAVDEAVTDPFAVVVASYTGAALDQAILTERGRMTQVVSLVPSGATTTAAASVSFTITFSEAVTGLAAGSFQLVTTGLQGAAITGVAPVAGSLGMSYDVTVSTGVGDGTVALTYLGGGVGSSAGEPLTAAVLAPAVTYLPISYAGAGNSQVVTGDFNGDGRPDAGIVSTFNGSSLTVYLNTGDGGFQAQPSLSVDAGADYPESPIATDVNGDGKADILVADYDPNIAGGYPYFSYGDAITVLLGNGDGTFQQPINTPLDFVPGTMAAGDFTGDGQVDLAVVDAETRDVHILLGDGKGDFTQVATLTTGSTTFNNGVSIATGDFNGDGKLDLAVSSTNDGTIDIFLGNGDGTFTALPAVAAGIDPQAIAVGDLNGDGISDIAVADQQTSLTPLSSGAVTVLLGKGDGTFTAQAPIVLDSTTTDERAIAIGDLNNDGIPDIALGGGTGNTSDVTVLLANGDGTYRVGSETSNGGEVLANGLALADVNGDGRMDVLTPGTDLSAATADGNSGLNVFLNEPATVVGSTSPAITIDRPAVAQPMLAKASGAGTLSQTGTAYTLNLGALPQGAASSVALALANIAAAPADSFDGLFSTPSGSGFVVTGTDLPQAVAAGGSYAGLGFAADTSAPGSYSETITFAPLDETAAAAPAAADPDTGLTTTQATPNPDAVAIELSPITLTVTDTVLAAGTQITPATLEGAAPVTLPNVRVGAADAAALAVTNAASAPAAGLDVTAVASGAAKVSGAITGLAAGSADAADLVVGLNTATAGALSGTVTLAPVSDAGGVTTPLPTVQVPVSGGVFRNAAAQVAPVSAIVHVGGSGSVALPVGNSDPADGFSESLIAAIASVTPGLTIVAGGPTADIAPGATNQSLAVAVSTAAAGTLSGTATLGLTSDGSAVDGLGTLALAAATAPIAVTVDNYARPTLAATGAALNSTILNFGAVQQGSAAVSATLDTVNSAAGPADALSGSYAVAASGGFTDSGFAAFSGDGAGQADAGGTITLQTGQAGTFSQTIVLQSAGSNASGYSAALADQTVTVEGTVVAAGTPVGSITTAPASLSVAQGAPATAIGITAPTDTAFSAGQLSVTLSSLPTDGSIVLADGTAVAAGELLTALQLTGLQFIAAPGVSAVSSTLGYTVSDPSGSIASGSATLAVLSAVAAIPPPTLLLTPPSNGPEAANPAASKAISNDPTPPVTGVAADGAQVALAAGATGSSSVGAGVSTADPSTGAYGTALAASLALGLSIVTATASSAAGNSPASAPASVYEIPSPVAGVSSPDISSLNVGMLFDQGYTLQFVGGTEAAVLVDGTLSVGPDTNEAYLQRLYEGLFGRSNDAGGMQFWDDLLAVNTAKSTIAADFMTTPEYQATFPNQAQQTDAQFVSELYQGFLGRAPTAADQAFWGGVADQYGRQYVLADVADSPEAKTNLAATTAQVWGRSTDGTLVHELYEAGLGREVELPGLAFWQNTLQTGALTPQTLAQTITTQPEFVALHAGQSDASYIASLYTADFGRAPDAAGAAFWGSALAAGTLTRASVLLGIATSAEAVVDQTRNV